MSESPLPSEIADNVRSDVAKRIPQTESLRRGNNIPGGMDTYLAGYIDAHYQIKDELETLKTLLQEFDRELRDLRPPKCYECGHTLGDEWRKEDDFDDEDPADCPNCGENPLPPVGASSSDANRSDS